MPHDATTTDARPGSTRPAWLGVILACFVASGVSGLVYQAIWSQYLNLILGSSAYAQSLVLAIFMGGMAGGAWLSARLIRRWDNPLLAYGRIEAAIGVAGIGFHVVFLAVTGWLYDVAIPGVEGEDRIAALRWTVAAALIVPQTVLLGMTFPVMSAGLMRWMPDRAGAVLGGLYFYNSIGAAGGALLATFVLVPAWGLPGAMAFAGLVNIVIYVAIWRLRVPPLAAADDAPKAVAAASSGTGGRSERLRWALLAAAALTGLSSFMYEVGWVRMLSLALGSSLHAFELMLSAFIGGLALGGLYVRKRLDGVAEPVRYVGWVQVFMGVAALATLPLYDHAFTWVGWLVSTLAPTASGYALYNVATAAISIVIMLPAAFFAGMTLPIMTYALLRRGHGETAVGHVYAANTLGAIIGVVAMTHFAMPLLGLERALLLAASIDLALGVVLLGLLAESGRRRALAASAVASVAAVALAASLAEFDPRRLHSGVYRSAIADLGEEREILHQADGKTASIALHGMPGRSLTISTNGKPDASITMTPGGAPTLDEPTMILAAILGLAFHPEPREIANIGFGSGLTSHTFASSSLPSEIVTVEIEPEMVEAARGFGDRVARAYTDPRSRIVIDDARAYFSGIGGRYDVIVSEPSNPWVSGVAKLFSTEFYGFARRHLDDGGLLVQWVQAYEISDATLLSMLRALDASFADYALFVSNNTDLLIVATPRGTLPEPGARFLDDPSMRELADIAGIRSPQDILMRRVADRRIVRSMLALDGGPANSDFHPVLAHWAPRDRFMRASAQMILSLHDSALGIFTLEGLYPATTGDALLSPPVSNLLVAKRRVAAQVHAALDGRPMVLPGAASDADLVAGGIGARLRAAFEDCTLASRLETRSLLVRAFQLTTPYLDDAARRQLWVERTWAGCAAPGAETMATLALFAALVERDATSISAAAATLRAAGDTGLEAADRPYLAHAAVYAALLRGDTDAAREATDEATRALRLTPRGSFELGMTQRVVAAARGLDAAPASTEAAGAR
jgi:predicted membrane-bound spermidine synthase